MWKKKIVKDPRKEKPEGVTVIKLTCREKGPGHVRIIMDLSSPKGRSINDNIRDEDFPAVMGGMEGVEIWEIF